MSNPQLRNLDSKQFQMRAESANHHNSCKTLALSQHSRAHLKTSSMTRRKPSRPGSSICQTATLTNMPFFLRAEPETVQFCDFKPNTIYQMDVLLRNEGKDCSRIRIVQPIKCHFRASCEQMGPLAAGLSAKLTVYFKSKQSQDYFDFVTVVADELEFRIPLIALAPKPRIVFQEQLSLKCLQLNDYKEFSVAFKNEGVEATISLQKQPTAPLNLHPEVFILPSGKTQTVVIGVQPHQVGLQKHSINVLVDSITYERTLDIVYTGMQFQRYLVDEQGHPCKQINFGKNYIGQTKVMKCVLHNNSPESTNIQIKLHMGGIESLDSFSINKTPQQFGKEITEKIIKVNPAKAVVKPFSTQQIEVEYKFELKQQHILKVLKFAKSNPYLYSKNTNQKVLSALNKYRIESEQFQYSVLIQTSDTKMHCTIQGIYTLPSVRISDMEIDFGKVRIGEEECKVVMIENCDQDLPVAVEFPKTGWFQVAPNRAVIEPQSKRGFELRFSAASLGQLMKTQPVLVAGVYPIGIKVIAKVVAETKNRTAHVSPLEITCVETTLKQNFTKLNKEIYNRVLTSNYSHRIITNRTSKVLKQFLKDKRDSMNLELAQTKCLRFDDEFQAKINPPLSFEECLKLPKEKDSLFVVRPIDKYEPFHKTLMFRGRLKDQTFISQKRSQIKNQQQANEIVGQLNGQMLKCIKTSSSIINFGRMFKNSTAKQAFFITNQLLTSIQVRLQFSHPQLCQIDKCRQIIGSAERARFQLILQALNIGNLKIPLRYIINQHHVFELSLNATVESVTLGISKTIFKVSTTDDTVNMELSDSLVMRNDGNSAAKFRIQNTRRCTFWPNQGVVEQAKETLLSMKYRPSNTTLMLAGQPKNLKEFAAGKVHTSSVEERAFLKVEDGEDVQLRVLATAPQPKCYIKETDIDFGTMMVCKPFQQTFSLKNVSKLVSVYEVDISQVKDCCSVTPMRGTLPAEGLVEFTVTFMSDRQCQVKAKCLFVNIRGGARIQLPLFGRFVIPYVIIEEAVLNFGSVSALSTSTHPLTFRNKSEYDVRLFVDLKACVPGLEYLEILEPDETEYGKVLPPAEDGRVAIDIQRGQIRAMTIKFRPLVARAYNFELPVLLEGVIKIKHLTKNVMCVVRESMLTVEPEYVHFKKKIVVEQDKAVPSIEWISIRKSPGPPARFKVGEEIKHSKVFSAKPIEGLLEADKDFKLRVSFLPTQKGFFRCKLPILLFNDQADDFIEYSEVILDGQGDQPKLIFDRLEAILPPVPLDVESRVAVKIFNEGYQNLTITPRLDIGESNGVDLKVHYPDGLKLGMNRPYISIIICFISHKSVSFTTKLQILDNSGKVYSLTISGTADNSILTVYPFLQNQQPTIERKNNQIYVQPTYVDALEVLPDRQIFDTQRAFVQGWLKVVLSDDKLGLFPEAVVESRGEPVLRLLFLLTGRKEFKQPPIHPTNSSIEFYQWLLRTLKTYGCLLNHIRAYFLQSQQQYQSFLNHDPSLKVHLSATTKYWFVSYKSWLILLYQIILHFGYAKQTRQLMTPICSNIYGQLQLGVLKWAEGIWDEYNDLGTIEFRRFRDIFRDGTAFIYLAHHYLPYKSHQLDIIRTPSTASEIDFNFRKLVSMMSEMGISSFVPENELSGLSDKEYCVMLLHLHSVLPHYVAKVNVLHMSCYLSEECAKYIDVTNPSGKAMHYSVRVEGAQEFTVTEELLRVQPKKTHKLKVIFHSLRTQQAKAYIVLTSRKDQHSGAAMVFEVRGDTLGRKSIRKLQSVSSPLYQPAQVRVPVYNMFKHFDYSNFQISLQPESKENLDVPCLFCENQILKLKKQTTGFIDLTFIPVRMDSYKYHIIFKDPKAGQFQYQISCLPKLPLPMLELRPLNLIYVEQSELIDIVIPMHNSQLLKAFSLIENRLAQSPKEIAEISRCKKNYFCEVSEFTVGPLFPDGLRQMAEFVKLPEKLVMSRKQEESDSHTMSGTKLRMHVSFSKLLKDPYLDVIMTHKNDIRVFRIFLNIIPKPLKLDLEIKCPARNTVSQMVPIINKSDKDWKFRVNLQSDSPQLTIKLSEKMSSLKEVLCKKGQTQFLTLAWNPSWITRLEARLLISNLTTNELADYTILAIGEQPLSENHFHISCKQKQIRSFEVEVSNPLACQNLRVQTDLINCYGAPTVTLPTLKKTPYTLTISPLVSGSYTGALTFYDDFGRYFWYTLSLHTEPQNLSDDVVVNATINRTTEVQLVLQNPLNERAVFQVEIQGEQLYGEAKIVVEPALTFKYVLSFRPDKVSHSMGRISFINQKLGEKIYNLILNASEPEAEKLPNLLCQIGRKVCEPFELFNHLSHPIELTHEINNKHFWLDTPILKPKCYNTLRLHYKPSNVNSEDNCTIRLHENSFGVVRYEVTGIGQYPVKPTKKYIVSKVNQFAFQSVSFTNPFDQAVVVMIELVNQKDPVFSLKNNENHHLSIGPFDSVEITFQFKPKQVRRYTAVLMVSINEKIKWRYELIGEVELVRSKETFTLSIQAKKQLTDNLTITITNIQEENTIRNFSYNLKVPPSYEELVGKYLELKLLNSQLESNESTLHCMAIFKPRKPFRTSIDFNITCDKGGVWRHKIFLQAKSPDLEGTIDVEAKHQGSGQICLVPINQLPEPCKFQAYIQSESHCDSFRVKPYEGWLAPKHSSQKTKLFVEFCPTINSKAFLTARLFIETELQLWIYELRGILPQYKPPTVQSIIKQQANLNLTSKLSIRRRDNLHKK